MLFKQGSPAYATVITREQGEDVLYINAVGAPIVPSIAENPPIMSRVVELLAENPQICRVVFVQQRNYNYPSDQILFLSEISRLYNFLIKQEEILSHKKLMLFGNIPGVYEDLQYILELLKSDTITCYLELRSHIKNLREQLDQGKSINKSALVNYIRNLERIFSLVESSSLIKNNLVSLSDHKIGSRELYKSIFSPEVLPNFTFTRLAAQLPKDASLVDQYEIESDYEKTTVTILKRKNDSKYFYHIMPSEYSLSEEHHLLLNLARNVLSEHRPRAGELTDTERTRQVFFNIARDMVSELSNNRKISLTNRELNKLAKILVRHTIGYGLIEVLLSDERLQDIVLNAPITQNQIFVRHEKYEECVTNIIPSFEDANSWAAKLRLQSARPLDEANPVLDTDLVFENTRARVAAIIEP